MSSLIERKPSVTGRSVLYLLSVPHRRSGRRIVIRDRDERVLFDTDDCYDLGNALARADEWIKEQPDGSL